MTYFNYYYTLGWSAGIHKNCRRTEQLPSSIDLQQNNRTPLPKLFWTQPWWWKTKVWLWSLSTDSSINKSNLTIVDEIQRPWLSVYPLNFSDRSVYIIIETKKKIENFQVTCIIDKSKLAPRQTFPFRKRIDATTPLNVKHSDSSTIRTHRSYLINEGKKNRW